MRFLAPTILAVSALALPASAQAVGAISSNWAGYVARPPAGKHVRSVSGTWVEPAVRCIAGRASYAAVWVGLGGFSQNAGGLEQIGSDSDCTSSGRAVYSTWFELPPAGARGLGVNVRPGDRITASATVIGRDATLALRDLTSGARASRTLRVRNIDVSTAEWIVESPSGCLPSGSCRTLPLADFGQVSFTGATATLGSTTSTITGGAWSPTSLQLQAIRVLPAEGPAEESPRFARALVLATPSPSSPADGSFTVTYTERREELHHREGPPLPGFGGRPPG